MRYGFRGANYTTTSACSSGAHAIGEAFNAIRYGALDAAVAGGAEVDAGTIGIEGTASVGVEQHQGAKSINREFAERVAATRHHDVGGAAFDQLGCHGDGHGAA